MSYEVYMLKKARKKLDKFPDKGRIEDKLRNLKNFPKVKNVIRIEDDVYRLRIGDYRALFTMRR